MGGKIGKTKPKAIEEARALATELKTVFLSEGREAHGLRIEVCGSIRRAVPVVGDVDMVVNWPLRELVAILEEWGGKDPSRTVDLVSDMKKVKKTASLVVNGIQVDLYFAHDDQWGAMLLFLTGSKMLNIILRGKAKKIGYKLNQYGLWHGDEVVAGRDEEQIFYALGVDYLTPEERSISFQKQKTIIQKEEMAYDKEEKAEGCA